MDNNRKKIKEAAALRYTPDQDDAPKIVAVGKGIVAEKIIQKAKHSNVPIHNDVSLSHVLTKLTLGAQIPPELFEIVAEILVYVANVDKDFGLMNETLGEKSHE